jgi:hypothetical protein
MVMTGARNEIPGLFGGGGWKQESAMSHAKGQAKVAHRKRGRAVLLGWWHRDRMDVVQWRLSWSKEESNRDEQWQI